jgi:hypothetical protein
MPMRTPPAAGSIPIAAHRRVRMTTVLKGGDMPPTADGTGLDVAPQPTAISKQLAESTNTHMSR